MMVGAKKLKKKKIFVEHSYIAQIFQNNKKKLTKLTKMKNSFLQEFGRAFGGGLNFYNFFKIEKKYRSIKSTIVHFDRTIL